MKALLRVYLIRFTAEYIYLNRELPDTFEIDWEENHPSLVVP
jgi:hypothetical protein